MWKDNVSTILHAVEVINDPLQQRSYQSSLEESTNNLWIAVHELEM